MLKLSRLLASFVALCATLLGIGSGLRAQMPAGHNRTAPAEPGGNEAQITERAVRRQRLAEQRQAAAANAAAKRAAAKAQGEQAKAGAPVAGAAAAAKLAGVAAAAGVPALPGVPNPLGTPDYMGGVVPNWAWTKPISKFVDTLPGLGSANPNNLGNFIPVATPDTTTFADSDFYRIGLDDYTQKLHSELPATHLRGYKDLNAGADATGNGSNSSRYLGPVIVAKKDRPVRIQFFNQLPISSDPKSNLLIPVDTTAMGCGTGPLGGTTLYTQNRAELHLHGGANPWISDGTPHQWITPAGDPSPYRKGVSFMDVPDMTGGDGVATYFYPNQQSARLMFYHDHSYGITRLNVYSGEAAGYLLYDDTELDLIVKGILPNNAGVDKSTKYATLPGGIYTFGIPLIIQDKTFVDSSARMAATDPTWNYPGWGGPAPAWGGEGDLWYPHVYMPNQNPYDISGANPMGRWDYGPWFWPPVTTLAHGVIPGATPMDPDVPGTPNPSLVPEAFMDTPLVNGTAYPKLTVEPKAYRFRILNAANDRFFNLSLYQAVGGYGGTEVDMGGPNPDARAGGYPNPATKGPQMIQIGTEGGFLPMPVVHDNQPIGFNYNRRDIVVLNVQEKNLFVGPAERADVIIDFSQYAGKSIILYNDAPAPVPAFDVRYDYYTGSPDLTSTGGAPPTAVGKGPNTRTIMRFDVAALAPEPAFDLAKLNAAFTSTPSTLGVFAKSQDLPIVPQTAYNPAFAPNKSFNQNWARIQSTSMTYPATETGVVGTVPLQPKAIQELFELDYGRMNATLGVELPFTNFNTQTTIPLGYIDPSTDNLQDGTTQLWKITHNGVDTHPIHFHLFNVQVVNRVGWDGTVRLPDPNELGWKETVRMNPLEDAIVAFRPTSQRLPFAVPLSTRPLDPTKPAGNITVSNTANGNPIQVPNTGFFAWEYVWHCHILGHEENDMMRPLVLNVASAAPAAPDGLTLMVSPPVYDGAVWSSKVALSWNDKSTDESGFLLQRQVDGGAFAPLAALVANQNSLIDYDTVPGKTYGYQIRSWNQGGYSAWSIVVSATTPIPVPGIPTPLNPQGPVLTATPTFTFGLVSGADGYVIQLTNTDSGAVTTTPLLSAAAVGTGSYLQPQPLVPGNYSWVIQAHNAFGASSPWSIALSFKVGDAPGIPVPTAPTGVGNSTNPAYTFPAVLWGQEYSVTLTNTTPTAALPAPAPITGSWLPAASVVNPTTNIASIPEPTTLAVGTYSFQVQARNALGASSSTPMAFTVGDVPVAPAGSAPTGTQTTATPVYTFNTVAWAATYTIQLTNLSAVPSTTVSYGPFTSATGSFTQPTALDPGNYSWTVTATNVLGTSPASAPVLFTVGTIPAAPAPTAPVGVGISTTPTYLFPAVPWGMEYKLQVTEVTNPALPGAPTSTAWLPAATVVANGQGSILQAPALAIGRYTFQLQARNALGTGPLSTAAAFTVGDVPVAPKGTAPTGLNNPASFSYGFDTVAWAATYTIQLTNLSATPNTTTTYGPFPAAAGATGSFAQPTALDPGNYSWTIVATNVLGSSPASTPVPFTVGTAPAAPAPTAPTGEGNSVNPTYVFPAVAWGMQYSVELTNTTGGGATISTLGPFPASSVVNAGIGAIPQAAALPVGTYSFRIQAINALGNAWSLPMPFTVGTIPAAPAGISPASGAIVNTALPTYAFNPVAWAAAYSVQVMNVTGGAPGTPAFNSGWLAAPTGILAQTAPLPAGLYSWSATAQNVLGIGNPGAPITFQVGTVPAAPVGTAPAGSITSTTPTYTFGTVAWAVDYQVKLTNTNSGEITLSGWMPAAGAIPQALALVPGNYTWSVQGRNALGEGAFSAPVTFTVGAIPVAPVGTAPTGTQTTTTPVYTFNTVAWAVNYQVVVTNLSVTPNTTTTLGPVAAALVGAGTIPQSPALDPGRYSWRVQASNALGTGPLSTARTFTIGAVPLAPVATAPTGNSANPTPTYTFSTVAWATEYGIQLTSNGVTTTTWVPAAAVGTGTILQATPLAIGTYTFRVQARNALGSSPLSNRLSFSVGSVPAAPVATSPTGAGTSPTPVYTFSAVATAVDYRMQLTNNSTGTTTTGAWIPAASVEAGAIGTIPQVTPLLAGNYSWRVEARNGMGTSAWSNRLAFSVGTAPTTAPAAIAPAGPGIAATPVYTFGTTVVDATDYQVTWVDTVTRTTTRGPWVAVATADPLASGTGTWTSTATLVSGRAYTWTVRARNGMGSGPASAPVAFTVQ